MTFRQFAYRNVMRNRRSYSAFFLASVFSVMVFFVYSMFIFHPSFEDEGLQQIALRGMYVAEIVLYVFTLFFLFYSSSAFLQARSKEFGILLQLGMTKRQLNRLLFLEMMLIGSISTITGTVFGFAFSKFFFMVGRELMNLQVLPLYLSYKPFAFTILAFLSLFVIISFVIVLFIRTKHINELMTGYRQHEEAVSYSKPLAWLGLVLLVITYVLAVLVNDSTIYRMIMVIPPIATVGTYLFFTHTIHYALTFFKRRKSVYWNRFRLVSVAESSVKLKESSHMFFIVTIVSTIAFLTVGTLASFSSYTGDYRQLNPLGLLYISFSGNEHEQAHISQLTEELEQERLAYELFPLTIKQQTSRRTGNIVEVLDASEVNELARALGAPSVTVPRGQAVFLSTTAEGIRQLQELTVETMLLESRLRLTVDKGYPQLLFPANTLASNTIIVNSTDFKAINEPLTGLTMNESYYTYYAFHVPDWTGTISVAENLSEQMFRARQSKSYGALDFYYENPGRDYQWFKSSFALLLFIGVLVAAVFLLAAGSFIYFKLYTGLERDRKQYRLLVRLGMTEKELVKIVNRQLIPQFFLPWILALVHSAFAFISLQTVWDEFGELSIVNDMAFVLGGFAFSLILYYYLIRWRYLTHLQAP